MKIARIGGVVCEHLAVARHLREDRSGCDGGAASIAVQHAPLRHHQLRNAERIDKHQVRQRCQRHDCATHRLERCPMNVHDVDFRRLRRRHRPGNRFSRDNAVETLPLERGHGLGIVNTWDVTLRIEYDGGGDDRAGKTAASHFVDARDAMEPETPEGVFESSHRSRFNHEQTPNPKVGFTASY